MVLIFGIIFLKEFPTPIQLVGMIIALLGVVIYFYPQQIPIHENGFGMLMIGLLGLAFQAILLRYLARKKESHTITLTTIPLIVGGGVLLIVSIFVEGIPKISLKTIMILGWLIIFNTIIGQLLYSSALREMKAVQTNLILNLLPFFTAIFAWMVLGEQLSWRQIAAMGVVFAGTYLVQLRKNHQKHTKNS
jgi:drug/metabolite transporter (DMT)-like permease